jgi:hypothetical protein
MISKRLLTVILAGSLISFLPTTHAASMTTAFGPTQYTREAGPPQVFRETFEFCGSAPGRIVVINGDADGTHRISSASIYLNGVLVIGPQRFNQKVAKVIAPIVLGSNNKLTIRLTSKPGSFLTVAVEYLTSPVTLAVGTPGESLLTPTTLLSALPVVNLGTAAAGNVRFKAITLDGPSGGTLTIPASLPFNLGTIAAGRSRILDADFTGGPFVAGDSHDLGLQGTYTVGGATYCFALAANLVIPPAAPGSAVVSTITVDRQQNVGVPFPPHRPDFDEEVNFPRWTVPKAPLVLGTRTPTQTGVVKAPLGDPPAIVFEANRGLGLVSGGANGQVSTVAEPSGAAAGGGVLFVTANWTAAFSMDGGNTFTQLDPTTIFPNDAVGFCCDQVVQYVPSIDRFVWLLQGNGYRLATASPTDIVQSGGTFWTYWNLTPQVFGEAAGVSFDYPDLSVGSNSLYISWDGNGGLQVARTALAGIQAAGTISIDYTHPSDAPMAWGSHLTQNTKDEVFWAGHNNNSSMRVFSLNEGSNTYFWRDVGISSWANNAPTSITPDGRDWLAKNFNGPGGNSFPRNGVIGATRSGSQLWFAWTAGTDSNFQRPHVEMVTLDRGNNFNKSQQVQVWNNNYAFGYPALATNACTGEVGLSFEFGGNGHYENHVVGFWGDFIAYITTGSNVGTTRFGDYVTIRQTPPTDANPGNLLNAFGYGFNSVPPPGAGIRTDVHYVSFGRPESACAEIIK